VGDGVALATIAKPTGYGLPAGSGPGASAEERRNYREWLADEAKYHQRRREMAGEVCPACGESEPWECGCNRPWHRLHPM
jgi:hypothetical protein